MREEGFIHTFMHSYTYRIHVLINRQNPNLIKVKRIICGFYFKRSQCFYDRKVSPLIRRRISRGSKETNPSPSLIAHAHEFVYTYSVYGTVRSSRGTIVLSGCCCCFTRFIYRTSYSRTVFVCRQIILIPA